MIEITYGKMGGPKADLLQGILTPAFIRISTQLLSEFVASVNISLAMYSITS